MHAQAYKPSYLIIIIALLVGVVSGVAGSWVYLSASYNNVIIKYAESVGDFNKLALKHANDTVKHIKEQSDTTQKLMACSERLMSAVKEECNGKKPAKRKKTIKRK